MQDDALLFRNSISSLLAGGMFAAGWWIFIDGFSWGTSACAGSHAATGAAAGFAWIPLFGMTLAFIMINGMKWSELRDDVSSDAKTTAKAKVFLLFALLIACACLAGSAFIMADKFMRPGDPCGWAGISCFVGTAVILLAAFVMRAGTLPPESAY